jgi:hypothetical protein
MKRHNAKKPKRDKPRNTQRPTSGTEPDQAIHEPDAVRRRVSFWPVARFASIVCAVFLALLLIWPFVGDAYSRAFIGVAHTFYHSMGSSVQVVFERIDERDGRDISMQVRNLRVGMMVERHIPSRYSGYLPTALLIALVVATPLSWRRRLISLLIGLIALHAYIAVVLLLTIVRMLSREGPAQLFELSAFWNTALEQLMHHTTTSPTLSMLVPVVIWVAATFRRGDMAALAEGIADRAE